MVNVRVDADARLAGCLTRWQERSLKIFMSNLHFLETPRAVALCFQINKSTTYKNAASFSLFQKTLD